MCRVRPFNQSEIAKGVETGLYFDSNGMLVKLKTQAENSTNSTGLYEFTFDRVFDMKTT